MKLLKVSLTLLIASFTSCNSEEPHPKPKSYLRNIPLQMADGGKVIFLSDYLKQKQKPRIKKLDLDSVAPGKALSQLTEAEREVVRTLLRLSMGRDD